MRFYRLRDLSCHSLSLGSRVPCHRGITGEARNPTPDSYSWRRRTIFSITAVGNHGFDTAGAESIFERSPNRRSIVSILPCLLGVAAHDVAPIFDANLFDFQG